MAATVFDTADLSTIRGGSYANLLAPRELIRAVERSGLGEVTVVFSGASQWVAILKTRDTAVTETAIERIFAQTAIGPAQMDSTIAEILPHILLIGAAVEIRSEDPEKSLDPETDDKAYDAAAQRAMARVRLRQLQRPTIDLGPAPDASSQRPCDLDGARPALPTTIKVGTETLQVSASVAARRNFGRKLRQAFLAHVFGGPPPQQLGALEFADSLHELVEKPVSRLPPALKNKMALAYLDGNRFGAIRAKHPGRRAATEFAGTVSRLRAALLDHLLTSFSKDPRMFFDAGGGAGKLRFELLMWGGDEACFVLPAWKVADLIALLAKNLESAEWSFEGSRLTHSIGILLCNYKMPIATARSLVEQMVDEVKDAIKQDPAGAKDGDDNALSVQFLDSIEPPAGSLREFRRTFYGTGDAAAFATIGVPKFRELLEAGGAITHPNLGFPRSQLAGLLADARRRDPLRPPLAEDALKTRLQRSRPSDTAGYDAAEISLADKWVSAAGLGSNVFGAHPDVPLLGLMRLAEMWEFWRPFPDGQAGAAR